MALSSASSLYLVYNPAAGGRISQHVLPLVRKLLTQPQDSAQTVEMETRGEGDGRRIGEEIRAKARDYQQKEVHVVLLGGDGTTHEVLNGYYSELLQGQGPSRPLPSLGLILVPTGTANALYSALYPPESSSRHIPRKTDGSESEHSWRLRSLHSYLLNHESSDAADSLYGLTLSHVTSQPSTSSSSPKEPTSILAHLITSHALHASILFDSESLREKHPGVERFKMAAEQNFTNWIDGTLKLSGNVQLYDPGTSQFTAVQGHDEEEEAVTLNGPIWYVISTSIDRLEPQFVPAPLAIPASTCSRSSASNESANLARPLDCLDIILIRPGRDPAIQSYLSHHQGPNATSNAPLDVRQAFAMHRGMPLTQAMYDEGKHIYLRYPSFSDGISPEASVEEVVSALSSEGNEISPDAKGEQVVEYYRCRSWSFLPSSGSTAALGREDQEQKGQGKGELGQRLCVDGTLLRSGRTDVKALDGGRANVDVAVWY